MQQRKGAVYGHRDLGAVQPQQAAQRPIPTSHPPDRGCASALPAGRARSLPFSFSWVSSCSPERHPRALISAPQQRKGDAGLAQRLCYTFHQERAEALVQPRTNQGPACQGRTRDCPAAGFRRLWYAFPARSSAAAWVRDRRSRKVSPPVSLRRICL